MFKDRLISCTVVHPAKLDPDNAARVSDEVFAVHQKLFDGVQRDAFERFALCPRADGNAVGIFRTPQGECVGYCTLQHRDVRILGRRMRILRGAMGFLPAYRGRTLAATFYAPRVIARTLGAWLTGRTCAMLASPVSPQMYRSVTRTLGPVWPHPERATPPQQDELLAALRRLYDMPAGEHVASCSVGWIARHSPDEHERFRQHASPSIQYFLANNPGYTRGEGLVVVAPLTVRSMLLGLQRAARTQSKRAQVAQETSHAVA